MCYSSSKFLGPVYCDIDSEKKNTLSKEQILLLVRHKHHMSTVHMLTYGHLRRNICIHMLPNTCENSVLFKAQ